MEIAEKLIDPEPTANSKKPTRTYKFDRCLTQIVVCAEEGGYKVAEFPFQAVTIFDERHLPEQVAAHIARCIQAAQEQDRSA